MFKIFKKILAKLGFKRFKHVPVETLVPREDNPNVADIYIDGVKSDNTMSIGVRQENGWANILMNNKPTGNRIYIFDSNDLDNLIKTGKTNQ